MSKSLFSIITENMNRCFICGSYQNIEYHHVFGASNRKNSEKYGLVVPLCHFCHNEPPNGVHHNKTRREALQRTAQFKFEENHNREDFMKIFGKNYI